MATASIDNERRLKLPRNADYGEVEVKGWPYEFSRRNGRFMLREIEANDSGKRRTIIKIYLDRTEVSPERFEWMPTEIYHIRVPGRRRFGNYRGIVSNSKLESESASLSSAVKAYGRK